jgi:glycosyltransferase involved in cell wall biosynthesis
MDVHLPPAPTRVLALTDYYLPGFRGGGPLRSITNMVGRLRGRVAFDVLTRDRDPGDLEPYPEVEPGRWYHIDGARVRYLAPPVLGAGAMREAIRSSAPDLLYLNSVFSRPFTLLPLLLRAAGRLPRMPVLVAPRGELSPGALALRGVRKRVFLAAARSVGLFRGVRWHAASEAEAEEIRRQFGKRVPVHVAPDLVEDREPPGPPPPKRPGELRAAFLSRIVRKKNLDGAIRMLFGLPGRVRLTVYGPEEDAGYAAECRALADALPPGAEVEFAGAIPPAEVGTRLSAHHVFLFPTHGESFGHVVAEALLAGCPVLLSDRTPWRNLEQAAAGWDLPLEDTAAFRAVLGRLVEMDGPEHARLSEGALRYGRDAAMSGDALRLTQELFEWALGGERERPTEGAAA